MTCFGFGDKLVLVHGRELVLGPGVELVLGLGEQGGGLGGDKLILVALVV